MLFWQKVSLVFGAGAVGGLVKALTAVGFTQLGINATLGSRLVRLLTPGLVYEHVVWGGLWGLLFLLPVRRLSLYARGALFSLGHTLVQLLLLAPGMGHGFLGLNLGLSTPFLVAFFGLVWGLAAATWLGLSGEK